MVSFLRIFQGRSSVLLLILVPLSAISVYYSLWDRSQFGGPGGIYWDSPKTGRIKFVPAVLFDSYEGDKSNAEKDLVLVHYLDNSHADACKASNIQSELGSLGTGTYALAVERLLDCFPEDIAKAAEGAGYSMVIIQSPFYAAGFQATQLWKSNSAPIPILEVSHEADVEDMHMSYLNVSTSQNILRRESNEIVLYILSVLTAFLGLVQIVKAYDRISGLPLAPSKLNTRAVTCILQFISGAFRIVFSVDIVGCFHLINYVFFRILLSMGMVFVFSTIFAVAFAYHFALVRLANGPTDIRKVKVFWAIGFLILVLITTECLAAGYSVMLSSHSVMLGIISAINAFCFQLFSGFYFVWTKHKVVSNLKQTIPSVGKGRLKEIERMAQYLYMATAPMILFLFSLVFYLVNFYYRDFQIITLTVSAMLLSITEIALVSSFPRRKSVDSSRAETRASTRL